MHRRFRCSRGSHQNLANTQTHNHTHARAHSHNDFIIYNNTQKTFFVRLFYFEKKYPLLLLNKNEAVGHPYHRSSVGNVKVFNTPVWPVSSQRVAEVGELCIRSMCTGCGLRCVSSAFRILFRWCSCMCDGGTIQRPMNKTKRPHQRKRIIISNDWFLLHLLSILCGKWMLKLNEVNERPKNIFHSNSSARHSFGHISSYSFR